MKLTYNNCLYGTIISPPFLIFSFLFQFGDSLFFFSFKFCNVVSYLIFIPFDNDLHF